MRQKDELIMEEIYSEGILDRMRARRDGREAEKDVGLTIARSLATTYMPRFQKIANNFANDLKKVNIDISMIEDDGIRTVLSSILNYKSE